MESGDQQERGGEDYEKNENYTGSRWVDNHGLEGERDQIYESSHC